LMAWARVVVERKRDSIKRGNTKYSVSQSLSKVNNLIIIYFKL
jgi:hypothetical protein